MILGGSLFANGLPYAQVAWRPAADWTPEAVVVPPPVAPLPNEQGWAIQIGAYMLADTARMQLDTLARDEAGLLAQSRALIEPVDLPGGVRLYRARFGPFSRQQADDLCARLARRDQSCVAMADDTPPIDDAELSPPVQVAKAEKPAALDDATLTDMRGGFLTAGGVQFDFGASVRTLVNGQLALQSTVQWTQAGAVMQQTAGPGATPIAPDKLAGVFGTGGPAAGVTVPASTGSTTVLANFAAGQVQNVLVNTASNQAVAQSADVFLTIYNLPQLQQQINQQLLSLRLANDVAVLGAGR